MSIVPLWLVLPAAFAMDLAVGDPVWRFHPVRLIGSLAIKLEPFFRRFTHRQRINGVLFNLSIVAGIFLSALCLKLALYSLNPYLGLAWEIVTLYFCLALRSLSDEGRMVARHLKTGDLSAARARTQNIVSRDLSREDERGVVRAVLESMTENLSDGIIAPMFFAMLGGAPSALAYKAINTLDSMVGYRDDKYAQFGWFSARLDDLVNLVPARLTGLLMVLLSFLLFRNPIRAIKAWWSDSQKGPSPNGGIPIVVFAGARDIALGGDCLSPDGSVICLPLVGGRRMDFGRKEIFWAQIFLFGSSLAFLGFYLVIWFGLK